MFVHADVWRTVSVADLGLQLLPVLPQARRQPLGAERLALRFSEVLVQTVGPLAHGADVEPQRVCRSAAQRIIILSAEAALNLRMFSAETSEDQQVF